ncbi:MAG TPA: APC family permease [Treponemataceae bacterium]|nr:APC family permease [Treponemataceae bacterium]
MGKGYGFYVGWFMAIIYYPTLTSVLAWVSARYAAVLFGWSITGGECMTLAAFFLVSSYTLNALSPILAGKFQVTTTVIKLIPLALMAVVGTIFGLTNGMIASNFTTVLVHVDTSTALFTAVVATSFAYEGWIIATSINSELIDSKKNLPTALVVGSFIVMLTYILYYIGLSGAVSNETLMAGGQEGARLAFSRLFSNVGGTLVFVFVIISCIGTLNGLMLGCTRGVYSIAVRNRGPNPTLFSQVDPITDMPTNSSILGLFLSGIWLLFFYGANLTKPWFGFFAFDSSELPIVTIYAMYLPIFILFMKKESDLSTFKRFVMPILALAGSIFMIVAACFAHRMAVVAYLIIFAAVMVLGVFFAKEKAID